MKYRTPFINGLVKAGFILMLSSFYTLYSCSDKKSVNEEHNEEHAHVENEKVVTISKAQFDAIKIKLGTVEKRNLTSVLRSNGFLKVPPQNKANISCFVSGTVDKIFVQEGDFVKQGTPLASIQSQEFLKVQQDFLEVQSQLQFSKAEYERQKELSKDNVTAKKVFQQSESNYKSLLARQTSLSRQLNMLGIPAEAFESGKVNSALTISSPISGNISHISINIGSSVQPGSILMDVVDNSQLHLDLFIYEQDIAKVKTGQSVDITLTNVPGKHYEAKIFAVGSAFEGESKSLPVHAALIGDKSGLIEGMNVSAMINIGNDLADAVPTSAIVNAGQNSYIFVQMEEHKNKLAENHKPDSETKEQNSNEEYSFRKIQVKPGTTTGSFTQVIYLEKVTDTGNVVTDGAYYLMAILTNEGEDEH